MSAGPAPPDARFTADAAYVQWLGAWVVQSVTPAQRRVLDIGCGDGALILHLADRLPDATFVGVDLSTANIASATQRAQQSPHAARIRFLHADYLHLVTDPADVIIASSVFQGMPAPTATVAGRLARDAARGAVLVHVTPYRCAYNVLLNTTRRALRCLRGPATDRMILGVAEVLHRDQPIPLLQERVAYMYLVLRHYEDDLRTSLMDLGFRLVQTAAAPHTSVGQPKHRLAIMSAPVAP